MHGRELFRFATERGCEVLREACSLAQLSVADVDCVLVHQANLRIVKRLQERTGIAPEKWHVNIGKIGNTAAASVLLTLASLLQERTPVDGTRILLGAFGAGLTWCAAVLEWGVPDCEYFAAGYTGMGHELAPIVSPGSQFSAITPQIQLR
jgi:3-oxoacyl-[acyl-carrier-protein] synthase-3